MVRSLKGNDASLHDVQLVSLLNELHRSLHPNIKLQHFTHVPHGIVTNIPLTPSESLQGDVITLEEFLWEDKMLKETLHMLTAPVWVITRYANYHHAKPHSL